MRILGVGIRSPSNTLFQPSAGIESIESFNNWKWFLTVKALGKRVGRVVRGEGLTMLWKPTYKKKSGRVRVVASFTEQETYQMEKIRRKTLWTALHLLRWAICGGIDNLDDLDDETAGACVTLLHFISEKEGDGKNYPLYPNGDTNMKQMLGMPPGTRSA